MRRVNCLAVSLFMVFIFALSGVLCGQRVVDLDKVWGDMRVLGSDYLGYSGFAVASGDVNSDGYEDLIIGAPFGSAPGRIYTGKTYVIFGSSVPPTSIDLKMEFPHITIYGEAVADTCGVAVASGDINGDGWDDIIIGANEADPSEWSNSGKTYVIFGRSFPAPPYFIDLSTQSADITICGDDINDFLGTAVASGDINGDSYDDIIIAAYGAPEGQGVGKTYVIFGSILPPSLIDLSTQSANITISGAADALASGNINGDAYSDLIIGEFGADTPGGNRAGKTHVIFGSSSPLYTINLHTQLADITVYGDDAGDYSGVAVASGNINGDAFDDIIIGAHGADPAGETYVIFGSHFLSPPYIIDLSIQPANITVFGGGSGWAVASGDVNGDGYNDLILGANVADPGDPPRSNAGKTYVVFGFNTLSPVFINLSTDQSHISVYGDDVGDRSGYAVASGNVNGDEYDDIIIGAPYALAPGVYAVGETYLILGGGPITVAHGEGGSSWVSVRDTTSGAAPFFYQVFGSANTNGEVHVARGDVDGDGKKEIICGHGYGGSGWVRGYRMNGSMIFNFKAFGDENANGEVHVGAGDVDGDGIDEIICGHGRGGSSWVKVFDYEVPPTPPTLAISFKAFGAANGQGEVHVAGGNVDGYAGDEIICSHGRGGSSWVKVFDLDGECIKSLKVFGDANTQGDVNVGAGDVDSTGDDEIICGHGFGGSSWIKVFDYTETLMLQKKVFKDENPNGEVHVAGGNIALDRNDEILCGHGYGGSSVVKVFEINGKLLNTITVFGTDNANGEVHVAACK